MQDEDFPQNPAFHQKTVPVADTATRSRRLDERSPHRYFQSLWLKLLEHWLGDLQFGP